MSIKCKTRLMDPEVKKKLFGDREVPDSLVAEIVDAVQAIKESVDKAPEFGNLTKRVGEYLSARRELSEVEKALRAANLSKQRARNAFIFQPAFKKDVVEGFLAMLSNTTKQANNATLNTENLGASYLGDWFNGFFGEMAKDKELLHLFGTGELDTEITHAVFASAEGKVAANISAPAQRVADLVISLQKKILSDTRNAGVPLRQLLTYLSPQTHSAEIATEIGYDGWRKVVDGLNYDKAKLFGDALGDEDKMEQILQGFYEKIVNGTVDASTGPKGEAVEDTLKNAGVVKSFESRLTETRSFTFLDAASEDAYRKSMGGDNLSGQILKQIKSKSNLVAFVEKFGSNPEASIRADIDRAVAKLEKDSRAALKVGDEKGAARLSAQARELKPAPNEYNKKIIDQFNLGTQKSSIPSNDMIARLENYERMYTGLRLLSNAGIKSLGNLAHGASFLTDAGGKNFLESILGQVESFAGSMTQASRMDDLISTHVFIEDLYRDIVHQNSVGIDRIGSKALGIMNKVNLQNSLTEAGKKAVANGVGDLLAKNSGKEFKALATGTQAMLLRGGIREADWAVIRAGVETSSSGRKMLTPTGIRNLPDASVAAQAKKMRMSPEKYKATLARYYASILNYGAQFGSTTAGVREKRIAETMFGMTSLAQSGTTHGFAVKMMTRFKSFALQAVNNFATSFNNKPSLAALQKGILVSEGKNFSTPGYMLVSLSALYYISDSIKQLAHGKMPKDPKNPDTWVEAMIGSGAGGLYMDVVNQSVQGRSVLGGAASVALGPTLGTPILGAVKVADSAIRGGAKSAKKTAIKEGMRTARAALPLTNAPFGIKNGLDYLQYDVIMKSLDNDGYQKSKAAREKIEKDTRIPNPFGSK